MIFEDKKRLDSGMKDSGVKKKIGRNTELTNGLQVYLYGFELVCPFIFFIFIFFLCTPKLFLPGGLNTSQMVYNKFTTVLIFELICLLLLF